MIWGGYAILRLRHHVAAYHNLIQSILFEKTSPVMRSLTSLRHHVATNNTARLFLLRSSYPVTNKTFSIQ